MKMKEHLKDKRLFLQWAVMAGLMGAGAFIAYRLGYAAYLQDDPTHITYVTLGLFALATAMCGRLCWRLCGAYDPKRIKAGIKHGWFAGNLCMYIGLIGTAVGYYLMLKHGNAEGDPKQVIDMGFANTAIAIVNTVVGAVTGVLLQVQSHFIEVAFEDLEPAAEAAAPKHGAPPEGGAP